MHAHTSGHREQPALPASRGAAGNLAQGHRNRVTTQNPTRGGNRILRYLKVLSHYIAGAKRDDPEWYGGAREALDNVEDGAIAAADNDGIVALCFCPRCLGPGSAVFARLHDVDCSTRRTEGTVNPIDVSAPCSCLLQYRVDEEQDLSHALQNCAGFSQAENTNSSRGFRWRGDTSILCRCSGKLAESPKYPIAVTAPIS